MEEKKKLRRRCACCGIVKTVGIDIEYWVCPFAEEIHGDLTKMWHCKECDYNCYQET